MEQLQLLNALEDVCHANGHHLVVYRMSPQQAVLHLVDEDARNWAAAQKKRAAQDLDPLPDFDRGASKRK